MSVNSANIVSQIEHDNNRNGILDDDDKQDILEVWFAGQHGDIGGGESVGQACFWLSELTDIHQVGHCLQAKIAHYLTSP